MTRIYRGFRAGCHRPSNLARDSPQLHLQLEFLMNRKWMKELICRRGRTYCSVQVLFTFRNVTFVYDALLGSVSPRLSLTSVCWKVRKSTKQGFLIIYTERSYKQSVMYVIFVFVPDLGSVPTFLRKYFKECLWDAPTPVVPNVRPPDTHICATHFIWFSSSDPDCTGPLHPIDVPWIQWLHCALSSKVVALLSGFFGCGVTAW